MSTTIKTGEIDCKGNLEEAIDIIQKVFKCEKSKLYKLIKNKPYKCYIYKPHRISVGVGTVLYTIKGNKLTISYIAVLEEFRQMEIGSLLLCELIKSYKNNNKIKLFDLHVRRKNKAARKLYAKYEFIMKFTLAYYVKPFEFALRGIRLNN